MHQRACESVGIDLGTTYSSLAFMDQQGTPRIVPDSAGKPVIPSAIFFDDSGIIVGEMALQQAKLDADRMVQFVKVHMGDDWRNEYLGHQYTAESLSAIILRHLVQEAEPQIGPIRRAVITVPAFFTEKRRRATEQAGEIAGLEVSGILNEPMAATLAYGLYRQDKEQNVIVYDLGGGTFDVTVNRITPSEIVELATDGNRQLGGKDWDQQLLEIVLDDFETNHKVDAGDDPQALQDLRIECEVAKRQMSRFGKAAIRFFACGRQHTTEVTREQFEDATIGLLRMTKLTVENALEDAALDWPQIDRVVLVGGSTHMPAVRRMLEETAGFPPDTGVSPVMAVALGAAIFAHMRETGDAVKTVHQQRDQPESSTPPASEEATQDSAASPPQPDRVTAPADSGSANRPDVAPTPDDEPMPDVRFVTAHGVGVKARDGDHWRNAVLIPKNSEVPVETSQRFWTTSQSGGGSFLMLEITQGDTTEIELAEILGQGRIESFPVDQSPGQPIDVVMTFDETGRLHIRAIHVNSGEEMEMSLEIPGGLRAEEVQQQREHLEQACFLQINEPEPSQN